MKRIGKNETTEINTVKKCFVGLEAALYLLFLALDAFSTGGGDGVKYLTIVVCLLAAVWSARHGGSCLMAWAMVFTLAADTFLLLLDRWYGMGIVLFCVVQGLYLARIRRACGRTLEPKTSTRGYFGSSLTHTGIGEPQKRLREMDQSRALASHLPNWPSLTLPGIQLICWFNSSRRGLILVTDTNQEETGL